MTLDFRNSFFLVDRRILTVFLSISWAALLSTHPGRGIAFGDGILMPPCATRFGLLIDTTRAMDRGVAQPG